MLSRVSGAVSVCENVPNRASIAMINALIEPLVYIGEVRIISTGSIHKP